MVLTPSPAGTHALSEKIGKHTTSRSGASCGMDSIITNVTGPKSNAEIVAFAKETKADIVIVGPEAPLAAGLAGKSLFEFTVATPMLTILSRLSVCASLLDHYLPDELHKEGIACFGPTKAAAEIEASKAFSKDFMKK